MSEIINSTFAFQNIDWATVPKTIHQGESGTAYWQTIQLQGLCIRIVEYSENYKADNCCRRGRIVHCVEGEFINEPADGQLSVLSKGMSYVVSDELSSHRSSTERGVKLLIIDGTFMK